MNKLVLVARILLGLVFFVLGLNGLLHFMPTPPMEGQAVVVITGLMAAGYLMPLMAIIQAVSGAMLLAGRFVPLALVLLAPIIINIIGFHITVHPDPKGFAVPIICLVCELYLAWAYRGAFAPMLQAKAQPTR